MLNLLMSFIGSVGMISLGIFLLTTNEKENYMNQFTPYNFTITNIDCIPSNLRNNYQAIFYDNNISITYPNVITGLDKCQGLFNITSNIQLYQDNNNLYWSIPPFSDGLTPLGVICLVTSFFFLIWFLIEACLIWDNSYYRFNTSEVKPPDFTVKIYLVKEFNSEFIELIKNIKFYQKYIFYFEMKTKIPLEIGGKNISRSYLQQINNYNFNKRLTFEKNTIYLEKYDKLPRNYKIIEPKKFNNKKVRFLEPL